MTTSLVDMLKIRHRICSCLCEDGSSGGLGKPIKCQKPKTPVPRDLKAHECVVGCGHVHFYAAEYLTRIELFRAIKDVGGEESALNILRAKKGGE